MSESKNVYQKIAEARTKISVKKNGHNSHGNYKYYQLNDIYTEARKVFQELGLMTVFNMHKEKEQVELTYKYNTYVNKEKVVNFKDVSTPLYVCTLDVINTEKPDEKVTFSMEIPYSQQDGASFAQSLGGTSTYATKYLFLALLMLDDTQDDDSTNEHKGELPEQKQPEKKAKNTPKPTQRPAKLPKVELANLLKDGGYNGEQIMAFIKQETGKERITDEEAQTLIDDIISGKVSVQLDDDDISMEQSVPPEAEKAK